MLDARPREQRIVLKYLGFALALTVALAPALPAQANPPSVAPGIHDTYMVGVDFGNHVGAMEPVHGVNSGPIIDKVPGLPNRWDLWVSTATTVGFPTIKELRAFPSADYTDAFNPLASNRYRDAAIPEVRMEGVDLRHLWLPSYSFGQHYVGPGSGFPGGLVIDAGGNTDNIRRKYSGEHAWNPNNYDWTVFDNSLDQINAHSDARAVVRVGAAAYKRPVNGQIVVTDGANFPPDDYDVFAAMAIEITERALSTMGSSAVEPLYVELWNEPYFTEFWVEYEADGVTPVSIKERALDYYALYATCRALFETHFKPVNGDYVVLAPHVPATIGGPSNELALWRKWFLDACAANGTRPKTIVPHLYAVTPLHLSAKLDQLAIELVARWPGSRTNLLATEWNRSVNEYAETPGAMPSLVGGFARFNQEYGAESTGALRVIGAHLYSARRQIWVNEQETRPQYADATPGIPYSAGLWLEAYGAGFFVGAPKRVKTVGTFDSPDNVAAAETAQVVRSFDVLAGRANDESSVSIMLSSLMAWPQVEPFPMFSGTVPAGSSYPQGHTVAFDMLSLPFFGDVCINRYAEAFNDSPAGHYGQFAVGGQGAAYELIESVTTSTDAQGNVFGFCFATAMKQNSVELIIVSPID